MRELEIKCPTKEKNHHGVIRYEWRQQQQLSATMNDFTFHLAARHIHISNSNSNSSSNSNRPQTRQTGYILCQLEMDVKFVTKYKVQRRGIYNVLVYA